MSSNRLNIRRGVYCGLLLLPFVFTGQATWADPLSTQQHRKLGAQHRQLSAQHNELLDGVTGLAEAVGAAGWQVTAVVDEDLCGSGQLTTPCSPGPSGLHTREAASSTNHNPVTIYVLVQSADGKAVDFLTKNQILFENRVGPGLGVRVCGDTLDEHDCGKDFGAIGNGQYVLYVHPAGDGSVNWKPVSYHFSITVFADENFGEVKGRTIGQINIPD